MCARSEAKGKSAIESLKRTQPDADLHLLLMDNASLPSVMAAANKFLQTEKRLDILYANAGIMATPPQILDSGYDAELQVNYISHFLLTFLLLPLMVETARSIPLGSVRVVNTTNIGHDLYSPKIGIDFDDMNQARGTPAGTWTRGSRYGMSKLANVLHAKEIARRYGGKGIWTASVHPGSVET
jgi:NAD(P)-dependent dehydrogenase (short-subunit alcohol dehydrogenase family)